MFRATLIRVLLAVVLAAATGVNGAHAQACTFACPPPPVTPNTPPNTPTMPSPGGGSSDSNRPLWIIGGVIAGVIGLVIAKQVFDPGPPNPPALPRLPPYEPPLVQLPTDPLPRLRQGGSGPGAGGAGSGGPGTGSTTTAALRRGFDLPPPGAPHVLDQVMLDIPASVPTPTLDAIATRHAMTRLETFTLRLTGRTLHRWRITGGGSVTDMIRNLSGDRQIAGAQAIFLFALTETAGQMNAEQYAPQKLSLPEAHRLATGNRVVVAVIDSEVDAAHPDLAGAVTANFNASDKDKPHAHGTGMAGAIAARRTILGTAPRVELLTVNAFSTKASEAEGTTFNILKGLDWAAERGARIINMSFAGPPDPRLKDALQKAYKKGIVLVAAAGNAGPNSPPLFPGADPSVIAVTATDVDDALFSGANRGNHIAVAAPGVDVLVPAPEGAYQFTTGTSVASAEVSGVVALMLERNPSLTPGEVRRILMATAKDLGPKGRDPGFGAGLVDALKAVTAAGSRPQVAIEAPRVATAR
jgi:Subtilase family